VIKQLRSLRERVRILNESFEEDLLPFLKADKTTFKRLPDSNDPDVSVTTTCSALMALATAYRLSGFYPKVVGTGLDNTVAAITAATEAKWASSKLTSDNAFTKTVVLRALGVLRSRKVLTQDFVDSRLKHKGSDLKTIARLLGERAPNSLGVEKYPPNPAIAYWFVDAIDNLAIEYSSNNHWIRLAEWAARQFARQFSLVTAGHDAMMDPVAMGMAACLCERLRQIATKPAFSSGDEIFEKLPSPVELRHGIHVLFTSQGESGIWPKYFPLFHYPDAGANYCFTFELLEATLHEFSHSDALDDPLIIGGFEKAVTWCEQNRLEYRPSTDAYRGWNSGGQITSLGKGIPESWATAVIHMFLYRLNVSLSQLIERRLLRAYETRQAVLPDTTDWDDLLDTILPLPLGDETSVKRILETQVIQKIESLDESTPRNSKLDQRTSALLFGPPGTSKTSVVRALARRIGWPCVELNPSHFLNDGLEKIYVRADEIFNDLMNLSRVVVLLDEMDALAQRRTGQLDITREFLTTSMLPKIAKLHDERQVLFFMATNHQKDFDAAIKRPGRFDLLLFMGPPTWTEKLSRLEKFWPGAGTDDDKAEAKRILTSWIGPSDKTRDVLDLFTFTEMKTFFEQLARGGNLRQALETIGEKDYRKLVAEWADKYITLRERDADEQNDIFKEYQLDRNLSRIQ
jgi:hypothetical protein